MSNSSFSRYEYVSFDVFDTLIKRSVAKPTDLFLLMEEDLSKKQPDTFSGFAGKRREAELRAYKKKEFSATFDDIYEELRGEYGDHIDELKSLEIRLELAGCRANPRCAALFQQCIAAGKKIVLISDMYLSSATIGAMLDKCGIRGYEKIFVSCECQARKWDGSLFRLVLERLGIRSGQLLHIGDNKRGDFLAPMMLGIRARWYRSDQKRICKLPRGIPPAQALEYRTVQACIRNCSYDLTAYEKQGCQTFGPLLLGFAQWLKDRLEQAGITDVYFMARDGYMMKQAFDRLCPDGFRTHYMYCSRRSFVVPMLWKHSSLEEVREARGLTKISRWTLKRFVLQTGVEPERYIATAKKYGLDMERWYEKDSFFSDPAVGAFYEEIRGDIEDNSKREYTALMAYIRSLDMHGKIAVVDIGYFGTMQRALAELLAEEKIEAEVIGYYVGVHPLAEFVMRGEISAEGYLYDAENNEELSQKIMRLISIYETLFLGPHGSVRRFVLEDGNSVPQFEQYEYDGKEGRIVDEIAVVRGYQEGALKLVEYVKESFPDLALNISADNAAFRLVRLGLSPTLREAELWGDMRFQGSNVFYIARPKSWWEYLRKPAQLKRDFLLVEWKIGYIKRLLKVPLPYERIVDVFRKVYNKL